MVTNYLFRTLLKKVRTWVYPQPSERYYQGLLVDPRTNDSHCFRDEEIPRRIPAVNNPLKASISYQLQFYDKFQLSMRGS